MHLASRWTLATLGFAVIAPAQSWTFQSTAPPVSFGLGGDLLVRDQVGPIGFDEANGATLVVQQGVWVSIPAAPQPRQQSALVSTGQRVYLFGGVTAAGPVSDLWRFQRTTSDWVMLQGPASPGGPGPRYGAKAVEMPSGWPVLVFGGHSTTGLTNDTRVMLDLGTVPLWAQQTTPPGLIGRLGHAMATGPEQSVVLFGGENLVPLGDTWIWKNQAWAQHVGLGPPAARDARMTYDRDRDMTVLLHPNGDVYEWNGFGWRRVGMTNSLSWSQAGLLHEPGGNGGLRALVATPAALVTYDYEPSPARSEVTFDAACSADPTVALKMFPALRSLPILGASMVLRTIGVLPNSVFVGAFELAANPPLTPLGCECTLALTGVGTFTVVVPGTGSERDWVVPIPNAPWLNGLPVDVQGVLLDPAAPCWLMTSTRNTLWPGW